MGPSRGRSRAAWRQGYLQAPHPPEPGLRACGRLSRVRGLGTKADIETTQFIPRKHENKKTSGQAWDGVGHP